MPDLPEPISKQDKLLHNIADGTPDISDIDPISRQDVYLKYIAENGGSGGGGTGGNVNVVQTTGTSTTDVMSQRAVTNNLCFGNGATNAGGMSAISLGYGAKAETFDTISIGYNADSKSPYSIALGSLSVAEENSVVSVGDGSTNSNIGTRRIVNVKDPTNNQDAATKKYVDDNKTTVVQTIGDSTTSVMSQNAITHMYDSNVTIGYLSDSITGQNNVTLGRSANSIGDSNITIGSSANSNNANHVSNQSDDCISIGTQSSVTKLGGISIGAYAECSGTNSVAIGYSSQATEDNVVSVSENNSSDRRRIVNVGTPINDYDAATKYYVDSKVVPVTLYSNFAGTTGTVTLFDSYSNYSLIKVYYKTTDDGIFNSVEFLPAYGTSVSLSIIKSNTNASGDYDGYSFYSAELEFSSSTAFVKNQNIATINTSVTFSIVPNDDTITIIQILGYN